MEFHKYLKIKIIGSEENTLLFDNPDDWITVQEKIDGANFRFMIHEGKIVYGSRTAGLGDGTAWEGGNWGKCIKFIQEKIQGLDLSLYDGYIFYGECCVKHTINYDWTKIPLFLGFDIMNREGVFESYSNVEAIYRSINLPIVPLIYNGWLKDMPSELLTEAGVPKSVYYPGLAEGLVYKNYKVQQFGKLVRKEFKEKNVEVFGGSKKYASDDDAWFVAAYYTNARIDKLIFKLLDDGNKLDLPLMKYLVNNVWQDIWEEEYKSIMFEKRTFNLGNIRNLGTKRCLFVLKSMIESNCMAKMRENI